MIVIGSKNWVWSQNLAPLLQRTFAGVLHMYSNLNKFRLCHWISYRWDFWNHENGNRRSKPEIKVMTSQSVMSHTREGRHKHLLRKWGPTQGLDNHRHFGSWWGSTSPMNLDRKSARASRPSGSCAWESPSVRLRHQLRHRTWLLKHKVSVLHVIDFCLGWRVILNYCWRTNGPRPSYILQWMLSNNDKILIIVVGKGRKLNRGLQQIGCLMVMVTSNGVSAHFSETGSPKQETLLGKARNPIRSSDEEEPKVTRRRLSHPWKQHSHNSRTLSGIKTDDKTP